MTKLHELAQLGQSIWLDYISRSLIASGRLQAVVRDGIRGVTSNPSIFEKAIGGGSNYDSQLRSLAFEGLSIASIYEAIVLQDIRQAADVLQPVYDASMGSDGFVSLEVSPSLAFDTDGTAAEARRLWEAIARPNVMIKVPATAPGIPAIRTLIGDGINVNATLMFSLADYDAVSEAYLSGLEQLLQGDRDVSMIASVASFFVSRVDGVVDARLQAVGNSDLLGKIAIANSKLAYARFTRVFSGPRWERLAAQGAKVQRPLWASTSTKNPEYSDVLYVENLIGASTVNTLPPAALDAFLDHGLVALTLDQGVDEARRQLRQLSELGIDLDTITEELQQQGVAAFAKSFRSLLTSIARKREEMMAHSTQVRAGLGRYESDVESTLQQMGREHIMRRIWAQDHTVWKPEPREIANRLGWLHAAEDMLSEVPSLEALASEARQAGYTEALLIGMGGSSLAAEVFRRTLGVRQGFLNLAVLDSTDPGAVLAQRARLNFGRTLFVVSSKSGTTAETLALFAFFYGEVLKTMGPVHAGEHFVAITDPGSHLVEIAEQCRFRHTFLNDPNIGGRYSALSHFGLVNAALTGADIPRLLQSARLAASDCGPDVAPAQNPGASLGTSLGVLAAAGRDKLTVIISRTVASFGSWLEQLIAESTGKEGKGILPVVGEPLAATHQYGDDRFFVTLELTGEELDPMAQRALSDSGFPLVGLRLHDVYDLGWQMFAWEMATAVAGHQLGINPFDQPNVESAKVLAREAIAAYRRTGALPQATAVPPSADALDAFLAQARPGDYIALQAFVTPTQDTSAALQELRICLRNRTLLATTWGYGPRFLHSTGQLHKGDSGNGLFIQLTSSDTQDAPIPDEPGSSASSMTFGLLKQAQAHGDFVALQRAGRRAIRFHLGGDVVAGLRNLGTGLR